MGRHRKPVMRTWGVLRSAGLGLVAFAVVQLAGIAVLTVTR